LLLAGAVVERSALFPLYSRSMENRDDYIERVRAALRINTAWPGGQAAEAEAPLLAFQDFLVEQYPAFHRRAERWRLSPYGVVYRWPGAAADGDNEPVLVLAHYDVVPAEAAKWSAAPFGGELRDEPGGPYVYGRGALDMKSTLMAIMESAEDLSKEGFAPRRDIWFAFGGDEERSGVLGAQQTARFFAEGAGGAKGAGEKVKKFAWILDEGGIVAVDQLKGVATPLALVGIEEKGFLSVDLQVAQNPGHASQPPEVQAVAVLAAALSRIERKHPFPFHLVPTVEAFFQGLAAHVPAGLQAAALRRPRLLGPLFFKLAASTPATAAMMRTTVAMTQLEGSAAENVLPSEARAVLNLRLLPPWTVESALDRLRRAIADPRVRVSAHGPATNPVPAAPGQERMEGPGWEVLKRALTSAFPGVPALPYLMMATTDSRHYQRLSPAIFRFAPQALTPAELSRIHGHDERISIANLEAGRVFYRELFSLL